LERVKGIRKEGVYDNIRVYNRKVDERASSAVQLANDFSGDKIKDMRWAGYVARMEQRKGTYKDLMESPRYRWEYNIKIDFQDVG
jgi:hypothetical protein